MTDKDACKYGGFMGHTVLVIEDCKNFGRSARLQTCSIDSAKKYFNEPGRQNPRIWIKSGKRWQEYKMPALVSVH